MIAEAYKEEKAYLVDKLNGVDTSLPDRLAKYGFTLDEYHLAKREHIFDLIKPEVIYVPISSDTVFYDVINSVDAAILIPIFNADKTAFVGRRNEIYEDECEGVDVIYTDFAGGTIVESKEDIHAIIVMPTNTLDMDYYNGRILELLHNYEPDAYRDSNDFMLDGEKIGGASFVSANGKQIYGINLTFADVSELCKKILPPRSVKPVGHIKGDYRDDLEADIISAFGGARCRP